MAAVLAQRVAFLAEIDDVSQFALTEAENAATVTEVVRPAQLAVSGSYVSRRYGRFAITEADIDAMVNNFSRQIHPVAPTELSVDYDHQEGKAAGWIKRLWKKVKTVAGKRVVELWGDVAWTKPATAAISNKEYRFFSPMFDRDFMTPAGKKIGVCLTGGALTNRPFLQGMTAISLSARDADVALPDSGATSGAKTMRLHKVKDKDGNEVEVDLDALKNDAEILKLSQPPPAPPKGEIDPTVKAMVDGMTALKDTVTQLASTIANRDKQDRKAEAERLIDAAIRSGRLAPVDRDNYLLLSESDAGMAKVRALEARKPNSVVKLRQASGGDPTEVPVGEQGDDDADDGITPENAPEKFEKAVADLMAKDTKLTYDDAMKRVEQEQPRLAKQFQLSFRRA